MLTLALALALSQTPQHRLFRQPNLPRSAPEYTCPSTTPGANLISAPEDISSASWTKYSFGGPAAPTITANYATAPDGTMTADRVQIPSVGTGFQSAFLQSVGSTSGTFTVSFYIKGTSASGTFKYGALYSNAVCSSGAYTSSAWTRLSFTGTITATGQVRIGSDEAVCGGGPLAAQDVLIWGVKVESGSTLTPYKAASCP